MNKLFAFVIIGFTLVLGACSNDTPELKSPCVGAQGSPCEKRRPSHNYV